MGPCRVAHRAAATIAPVLEVLLITFPFFALVLAGFVAAERGMLPLSAIPGLNGFVLFFALPALLYRFGASTPIAHLVDPAVFGIWLLCAALMVFAVVTTSRGPRIGWNDAAFGALVATLPNTGFMGVPLLVALFGDSAAGTAIITIVVDLLFTSSLCIALSQLGGNSGATRAAGRALRGVVVNPLPWAVIAGGIVSATGIQPWAPIRQTIDLLAEAASPVALFTIGAVLARSRMLARQEDSGSMETADYLPLVFVKLVMHPLLVLCVGVFAIHLGAPLSHFALTIMVLVAALPAASNVAILSERFGADTGRIARIILLTTAAAFLTFSGAVALFR